MSLEQIKKDYEDVQKYVLSREMDNQAYENVTKEC